MRFTIHSAAHCIAPDGIAFRLFRRTKFKDNKTLKGYIRIKLLLVLDLLSVNDVAPSEPQDEENEVEQKQSWQQQQQQILLTDFILLLLLLLNKLRDQRP